MWYAHTYTYTHTYTHTRKHTQFYQLVVPRTASFVWPAEDTNGIIILSLWAITTTRPLCVCVCVYVLVCTVPSFFIHVGAHTHTHTHADIQKDREGRHTLLLIISYRGNWKNSLALVEALVCTHGRQTSTLARAHAHTHTPTNTHIRSHTRTHQERNVVVGSDLHRVSFSSYISGLLIHHNKRSQLYLGIIHIIS